MSELPLSERRGFEFSDFGCNRIGILMVKAPIEEVSPILTQWLYGRLENNVLGQANDWCSKLLFQYCGHDWTIVFPFDILATNTVSQLSQQLETRCIYLEYEDTSDCFGYRLFDRGTCIEEFNWGCDYTEEIFGIKPEELLEYAIEREKQGNPILSSWDPRTFDVYCFDDYRSYAFRSTLNTATEAEVIEIDKFLDTLFRAQDAWLPDWDYLPCEEKIQAVRAKAEDFVRVDLIRQGKSVNEVIAQINTEILSQINMEADDTSIEPKEDIPF